MDTSKILVVKLDHIGDLLLATPVFHAIKRKYPNSYLAVLASDSSSCVLKNNPYVDKVYCYNSKMFLRNNADGNIPASIICNNLKTIFAIRNEKFTLCIGLREDYNNVPLLKLLDINDCISFNTNTNFSELLTESVANDGSKHISKIPFDLLEKINVPKPDNILPEIYPTEDDAIKMKCILAGIGIDIDNDTIMIISPGGGWWLNWWPWKDFASLCNKLTDNYPYLKIIMIGSGEAEEKLALNIQKNMEHKIYSLVNKTTIHQLAVLFKSTKLLVTNDGGMMHLGSSADIPIIALFGPSPYKRFRPLGKHSLVISKDFPCSPCPQFVYNQKPHCLDNRCMQAISVDEVYKKAVKILADGVR
jgi:heptosyltransferase-2